MTALLLAVALAAGVAPAPAAATPEARQRGGWQFVERRTSRALGAPWVCEVWRRWDTKALQWVYHTETTWRPAKAGE